MNRAAKVALFFILTLELMALFKEGRITTTQISSSQTFDNHDVFATHSDGGLVVVNRVLNCTSNGILPSGWCMEEESQTPRYCLDTTTTANSNNSKVNHTTTLSGGSRLSSPIVNIRHYTHMGYEMCLAGKTLVFIGDSRVRFQYLNLAHFLVSPSGLMHCDDHPTRHKKGLIPSDQACYIIGGNQLTDSRNVWYKNSTNLLSATNQVHLCDCYRHDPFRPKLHLTVENRFVKRYT